MIVLFPDIKVKVPVNVKSGIERVFKFSIKPSLSIVKFLISLASSSNIPVPLLVLITILPFVKLTF